MIPKLGRCVTTLVLLLSSSVVCSSRNASQQYDETFVEGLLSFSPAFALNGKNLSSQCLADTQEFIRDLHRLKYWALQMYDSTGKLNSGLLNGNLNAYGDFEQCLSIPHPRIKGKYCLLGFDADFQPNSSYQGIIRRLMADAYSDRPFHGPEHKKRMESPLARQKFFWGFCIPSTCGLEDLKSSLEHSLTPLNSSKYGLKIDVISLDESCTTEMRRNFTKSSYLVMFLIGGVLLLVFGSTFYDNRFYSLTGSLMNVQNQRAPVKVFLAFSLKRTVPFFLDTSRKNDGSDISCVNGIRFLFALILFITHRSQLILLWPMVNKTTLVRQVGRASISMISRATMNNIDVFVLISGLLASFHGLKQLQSSGKLNVPLLYLKRYAKFTPGFLFIALLVRDIAPYFSKSPHNISVVDVSTRNCRNLWRVLTYTGNFDFLTNMCCPFSHQLHTDMQMYLLAPFLSMFLWRYRARAFGFLSLTAVLISLYSGWVVYRDKLTAIYCHGTTFSVAIASEERLHLNTFHRLPPYLIGTLLGYVLHSSKTYTIKLTKPLEFVGHVVSFSAAYYSYFWLKECAIPGHKYNALEMALYGALQPIVWNFAVSWLIFVCYTGRARILDKLLSLPPFLVFSRMSYAFYMVQNAIIVCLLAINRVPIFSDLVSAMDAAIVGSVLSAAVFVTLTLYLPMILIEKHLRSSEDKSKKDS